MKEQLSSLSDMCKAAGPLSTEHIALLDLGTVLSQGQRWVAFDDGKNYIWDEGTIVIDSFAAILPKRSDAITRSQSLRLFVRWHAAVFGTWDTNKKPSTDALPHTPPLWFALASH